MGIFKKLKLWVQSYFFIWKRQADPAMWGYQFLILIVGVGTFLLVSGIFLGFDILLGITDSGEYYTLFWNTTGITSLIVGILSALRFSYEIVSRGWI
jgi:hypothetical protein